MSTLDEELAPLLNAPSEYIELRNRLFTAMGSPKKGFPFSLALMASTAPANPAWQLG